MVFNDKVAEKMFEKMNDSDEGIRLAAAAGLKTLYQNGSLPMPQSNGNVNNHIHTQYSFSPYSPAKAAYMAWVNGLDTAGIMDHDSIAGAEEFIKAGEIFGIATTIGFECRVDFSKTQFNGKRLNNPDQASIAYVAMHGIPHQNIARAQEFLTPYREKRNLRNRKMVENINGILSPFGISIDFDADVLPISNAQKGGSVTERHILFAVANKLLERFGKGEQLIAFLQNDMGIHISEKNLTWLSDLDNPYYAYDLLGVLKSDMVEKFYIPAKEECPDVSEFIALAKEIGAIPAYAYLGDVGSSVTGDKKAQKFEDDFLPELVEALAKMGFCAITYMPTRNTLEQLQFLSGLCEKYSLFQISGEDINSPRQKFKNDLILTDNFKHLVTATWALIGHEKAATKNIAEGMFTPETVAKYPDLNQRIAVYEKIGRE